MKDIFSFLLLLLMFSGLNYTRAQTVQAVPYYPMLNWNTDPYHSFRFTPSSSSPEKWINFRILYPEGYDSTAQNENKYPLTIILHGAGESGRMEWNNTTKTNQPYPEDDPRRDNNEHHLMYGGREHLQAVESGRFPGFVLFPQNFYGSWIGGKGEPDSRMRQDMKITLDLLGFLIKNLKIDPKRIYIQGLSNGGLGSWYAAYQRPDLFAAVLPMSAQGHPSMAPRLANIPLWVFQGENDDNPFPHNTERTVEAIQDAGGSVRYTLYPNTGHNTWNKAYQEQNFFEWMLGQTKENEIVPNKEPAVYAGDTLQLLLPVNSVDLTGSATDEDGIIVSSSWSKVSGPSATILQSDSLHTRISDLEEGFYVFRISVTDDRGATAHDEISIIVEATPPPLAVTPSPGEQTKKIQAFPNPFQHYIELKIPSEKYQEWSVSFLNPQGRIIFQSELQLQASDGVTYRLENDQLRQLSPGIYYIQLQNKKSLEGKTLMVLKK